MGVWGQMSEAVGACGRVRVGKVHGDGDGAKGEEDELLCTFFW